MYENQRLFLAIPARNQYDSVEIEAKKSIYQFWVDLEAKGRKMRLIKFAYDQEGDILEVRFMAGKTGNRTGIGLNEGVTLFCDRDYSEIHGLTILAYSKLVSLLPQPLSELDEAPPEIQKNSQIAAK